MKTFAVAVTAETRRKSDGRNVICHSVAMLNAESYDEALGMGHRIAHKMWPDIKNWVGHFVDVIEATVFWKTVDQITEHPVPS